ncbi:MAG: transcription antitermination factor NusB [Candidatus Wallbacteria bacterium]|nr:transcription antitermination factor NusB [Candidatus Wallbacteria bacterium]
MIRNERLEIEVLRRRNTLLHVLEKVSGVPENRISAKVLPIMLRAVCEHYFLKTGHPAQIVSHAVTCARKISAGSASFANAVLRKALSHDDIRSLLPAPGEPDHLELLLSFPSWIVNEAGKVFADPGQSLAALNESPPFTIRMVSSDPQAEAESLTARGFTLTPASLPKAFHVQGSVDITGTPEWRNGKIYIQDEASMLVADIASKLPGRKILDLCASPGGKITLLSELLPDSVCTASDLPDRLGLLRENIGRMKLQNIKVCSSKEVAGPFDIILVDAPCSSLGVIRRHPGIKWEKRRNDLGNLSRVQLMLLEQAVSLLSPGGHIVYSTCTFSRLETVKVVENLLSKHSELEVIPLNRDFPDGTLTFPGLIMPGFQGMDCFFIAVLKKQ